MRSAMFRVKHRPTAGKRGSNRGQDGSGRGLGGASGGLKVAALALCTALLAACSSPEDVAEKPLVGNASTSTSTTASGNAATATATATGASAPGAVTFEDNASKGEAAREFAYGWPAEASAIPALAARFTAERARLLAEQKSEWDDVVREYADQDCIACVNRSFDKTWEVVANLPRFLSLSADFYDYSGGAHGNSGHDALVWDREAGAALDPLALFRSQAALQDALGGPWCKALKAERMKRLGADYSDDSIFACPPIADLTVLLGSSDKRTFNRIGLLAAPYVAGSYVEGTYEVTFPVTPQVLAAVKPTYKSAFALTK